MGSIQTLTGILGLAFVSGINLYAAVLVVGLGIRYGWLTGLPAVLHPLAHPAVLIVAGIFYLLEFFADKIPFVSTVWDAVHTLIRPLGGALLALGAAAELDPVWQAVAFLAGGAVALSTHSTKMGFRILAHTTPEPVTHSLVSVLEDVSVVGLLVLAYKYPRLALAILLGLLVAVAVAAPLLFRILRFAARGLVGRILSWIPGRRLSPPSPAWLHRRLSQLLPSGGEQVYPCFARSVPKAPRMQRGFLVCAPQQQFFVYRRFFHPVVRSLEAAPFDFHPGLVFDVLTNRGATLYLPKDVSCRFRGDLRFRQ